MPSSSGCGPDLVREVRRRREIARDDGDFSTSPNATASSASEHANGEEIRDTEDPDSDVSEDSDAGWPSTCGDERGEGKTTLDRKAHRYVGRFQDGGCRAAVAVLDSAYRSVDAVALHEHLDGTNSTTTPSTSQSS